MHIFWIIGAFLILLYAFLWYYFKITSWCKSQTCLLGKTAIVTGANTGIGYETALDFAKRGARVLLACRNTQKAEDAKTKIIEQTGNLNIVVKNLDLTTFASVRAFAKDVNETEQRLDILVNNAGIGNSGDEKTDDGLLCIMQVNYFSSFLLTNLLIGLLKKSAPSRVINVSSIGASRARFDINNLNKSTGHFNNYACSKLCNILFTKELAQKLRGTNITTYSLHPGGVETDIWRYFTGWKRIMVDLIRVVMRTPEEGAQTTIYTSVARNLEQYNGEHFDNCKRVEPYTTAKVPGLANKLWRMSEELVNLRPDERII